MKPLSTRAARPPRAATPDTPREAQAAMAGFIRVLERLVPGPEAASRRSPAGSQTARPAWPTRILQEKP